MRHFTAILVCSLVALPSVARAQQPEDTHNMPMGMGSDFAPGPTPLGGQPGVGDQRRAGSSEAVREMERRGSLDDAMRKLPDVSPAQKDSVRALEKRYGESFKSYAVLLKATLDAPRPNGAGPDLRALGLLRLTADSTRSAELTAARALLTTDAQREVFDRNVAELRAREAKREEQRLRARP
ncbi:MAG: hypothetical protein JF589_10865 [Gemmatimonadetes bacterium]|nr:hypothetical protein [Gemmatimonadota bacterium]